MLAGLMNFVGLGGDAPAAQQVKPEQLASPKRTSAHSTFRSRCCQRAGLEGDGKAFPVKCIIFDLDETLTLVSYMIEESDTPQMRRELVKVNFETPWVEGSRIAKLQDLFEDLKVGKDGEQRFLAVLSRNSNGAEAVLRLLKEARGPNGTPLSSYFCVIWTMPKREKVHNGAYQTAAGEWRFFRPPLDSAHDHKADVLHEIALHPASWFPQCYSEQAFQGLQLRLENMVLVDDQRANFQSPVSGRQVLRYCKVARYDAAYRNLGLTKNMGGLGAHSALDYETLLTFVDDPAACKETLELKCVQRNATAAQRHEPVKLVVFDFDETLTMATFFPEDDAFREHLDWNPEVLREGEWSAEELLRYNFETPFVAHGNRLQKLRAMLADLESGRTVGHAVTLAVLSRNEQGAVSVLNFLRMAALDEYFSAVWTMPYSLHHPTGVYRVGREWKVFEPPLCGTPDHKANVLRHVTENPAKWLPQLSMPETAERFAALRPLRLEHLVLVDDERANFLNSAPDNTASLVRFCKVARYDEIYRNCGPLNQMGGIGAHSDADYQSLLSFIQRPWTFAQDVGEALDAGEGLDLEAANLQREAAPEEEPKVLRIRLPRSLSNPELRSALNGGGEEAEALAPVKRVNSSPAISPSLGANPDPPGFPPEFDLVAVDNLGAANEL